MNQKYGLKDFTIVENPDTNIYERIVSLDLSKIEELHPVIVNKLEALVNVMIAEYEREHEENISVHEAELGIYMEIDTKEHILSLNAYIGYDYDKECIVGKKILTTIDEDYLIIKKFFFDELNKYILEQVKRIQKCVA